MPHVSACPQISDLRKLALGHLTPQELEPLVGHLETCDSCLRTVHSLPSSDPLIDRLAQAKSLPKGPDEEIVSRLIERLKHLEASPPPAPQLVSFACPSCGKTFRVKAELAGRKGKCQKCGKPVVVPVAVPPASDQKTAPPPDQSEHVTLQDNKVPAKRDATSCGPVGRKTKTGAPSAAADSIPVAASYHGSQLAAQEGEVLWDFLAPSQAPDELGRLGPYRVLKVLGHGGMGVVFKAEDPGLKRLVALKAMLPSQAQSPTAKARFIREARAAAALKHDHIVTIYQVGEDRDVPFLAMEFLHGEPLDARLQRESILPVPEVLRIGREIAEGLAAAHEEKLIHRDIKPGNIWLERKNGRAKILDFGLARSTSSETNLTQLGHVVGTPAFMAPEQAGGVEVDHRCDLFSLGCVLYRMTTGEMAFKGHDTMSILMSLAVDTPKPPRELNPEVPAALSDLIMKLLAKEAKDRPATATVVVEELARLAGSATKESVFADLQPSLATKPQRASVAKAVKPAPAARKKWLFGAGVAACVIVLGLVGLWAAGVIFVKTKQGTIVLENVPADAEVTIDGEKVSIKPAGDKGTIEIVKVVGKHLLEIKAAGFKFQTQAVTVSAGERQPIRIKLEKGPEDIKKLDTSAVTKRFPAQILHPEHAKLRIEGDELVVSSLDKGVSMVFGDPLWQDYDFSVDATWVDGPSGLRLLFRYENGQNFFSYLLARNNNTCHEVRLVVSGEVVTPLPARQLASLVKGKCYTVKVSVRGERGEAFLDGSTIGTFKTNQNVKGRVGLGTLHTSSCRFKNIVVKDSKGAILLEGLPDLQAAKSSKELPAIEEPDEPPLATPAPGPGTPEKPPIAPLPAGSVWKGTVTYRKGNFAPNTIPYELHVRERDGTKLKGHIFDNGPNRNRREVEGEIKEGTIAWREWSDREFQTMVEGTIKNDVIQFKFKRMDGQGRQTTEGDGELKRSNP